MKCPNCGAETTGAFCAECGSPLKGAKCRECNAALPAGANYCTNCGASVARRARATSNAPWFLAGAALLILVVVLMWPALRRTGADTRDQGRVPLSEMQGEIGADNGGAAPQGPLSGTPREQADRLFNRVMTERENGDTARAKFFLPMAIQAYQIAGELDADGLYHLSLLQSFGGDYAAARASAERILSSEPNHLLALAAAASAARGAGDGAAARKYYQRLLAAYETESKTNRPEYLDHARILPEIRSEAQEFVR